MQTIQNLNIPIGGEISLSVPEGAKFLALEYNHYAIYGIFLFEKRS